MRVGVIRGDLPGPVFLADLESISRRNPPTEPPGQEAYVSRPTVAELEAVLSSSTVGAGAVIEGSDIVGTFPITINAANDDLKVRTSSTAAYTTVLVPNAVYATLASLLAALNTVLGPLGIVARQGTGSGSRVAIEGPYGVSSYIGVDSVVGGSVANTPLGFGALALVRTQLSAATIITGTLPVAGPLDVSTATLDALGATTAAGALALIPSARGTHEALADAIAPQFIETTVAIDCFLVGYLSDLLNVNFTPDSRRVPPLTPGPAVTVVEDDGVTLFSVAHTLPTITSATLGVPLPGYVAIVGTGLGNSELISETTVRFTGAVVRTLSQQAIVDAGGFVSDTAILVPASLIPGATTTTTSVRVKVRAQMSAASVLV